MTTTTSTNDYCDYNYYDYDYYDYNYYSLCFFIFFLLISYVFLILLMTATTTTTATTRSSFPLFRMSARAETFSEFQFMLSSNSLNVSAPVLTAARASRYIQRIRNNFHTGSLNVSARVLISDDLLSMRF